MSSPSLRLVSSQDRPRVGQIHRSNAFDRSVVADAVAMRADLPVMWQRLVKHLFGQGVGARAETAVAFCVTLQTACNWHEGAVAPSGPAVAHAWAMWPDACAAFLLPSAAGRRAA